jgi:uncharacterized protein YjbI with pentapeptide repeats
MKTIKPTRLSVLTRVIEHDHRPKLVVGVTAAFRLGEERHLVSDMEMWPLVVNALEAEQGVFDEVTPKVRGEVLVAGCCHVPGGMPRPVSFVRVKIGSVDKRLAVIGDRRWQAGIPTEPRPFSVMPVDWTRAFGGEGFEKNPSGRGAAPVESDEGRVHWLPNIEEPRALITSPSDRPEPAGLGGLALTLPQRRTKFGTYGHDWLATRAYGFAEDMDPTVFNLAPADQWLEGWFRGDEAYLIENMHPERARIEGRLPPLAARVFVTQRRTDGSEAFKEVALRIDTVRFFPELLLGVLVFRGVVDVVEDDADDIRELMLACEDREAPRSVEHYRRALEARRNHEQAALLSLSERDIVPPAELGWRGGGIGEVRDGAQPEFVLQKNLERRHAAEVAAARERLVAAGLDPKDFALDESTAEPEIDLDDPDAMAAYIRSHQERRESQERELAEKRKKAEADVRATFAAQGLDYDAEVERVLKEHAGPPKLDARRTFEHMKSLLALAREHGQPNLELEQRISDPSYLRTLVEGEERLRQSYRLSAHRQVAIDSLSNTASDPFRVELTVAHLNAIGLEARDFSGVDLTGMQLPGLDLTDGFLESANLTDTDFTGANLTRTVLAHARLHGTRLTDANLGQANLGSAELVDVDLSRANLTETILEKARIARTSFRGVRFDKTSLLEAVFGEDVDFGEATAELMIFYKVDLRGVRFKGARFTKCAFVECDLRGADLEGVDLSATTLVTCPADGARFSKAVLEGTQFVVGSTLVDADFTGARMPNASLRGLDLRRVTLRDAVLDGADLSKSDLSGANLSGVSARQAMFIGSTLTGAKLTGADLLSALLSRAKLHAADFSGASLFQADLAKVQVDASTNLDRVNLERARMHPKYQPPRPIEEEAHHES